MKLSRRQSLRAIPAALVFAADTAVLPAPVRLVVLDVGGTIIQDRGDVPEAMRSALGKRGIAVTPAEIASWRGASKREAIRHFVELRGGAESLVDAIYADFDARVQKAYESVPPIAGVEEAFRTMRRSGLLLAANTGFDRDVTSAIFRRLGWEEYFAAVVSSSDVAQGRPAPFLIFHAMEAARVTSVHEVMAVGDTPLDLQAASNAGVSGVGVLSGIGTAQQLRREPHAHIIGSVAELPALLRAKFGVASAVPKAKGRPE